MDVALSIAGSSVRALGALSPGLAATAALPLFARVARPRPVADHDIPTMDRARRSTVRVAGVRGRGVDVVTYAWGGGGRGTIALAHGWDGRASQFATLTRELVAEGFRVVAFDAPAHGDTLARGTYLIDWTDILTELQGRYGTLAAVVGHSFGGLAALVAAGHGLDVARVVSIAAPAEADSLLSQFQSMLRLADPTAEALRRAFASRYFPGERDPFARLSPLRHPVGTSVGMMLVHDERDRVVPVNEVRRLADAHPHARVLLTGGFGHNRVLSADPVLDAILEFVDGPVALPLTTSAIARPA